MKYSALADVYDRLEATQSNLEKTDILAEAFREADDEELGYLVRLCMGRVFAAWKDDEIGISSQLMMKAISKTTGMAEDRIEDSWRETGDLGDAARELVKNKKQQTLMSKDLTVELVVDNLQEMAEYEGSGSQEKKIDSLSELISHADPREARYIVRTVLGAMRLGVGEGTVRDAIALAFFAEVMEPDEIGSLRRLDGRIALQESAVEQFEDEEGFEYLKEDRLTVFTEDEIEDIDLSRGSFDIVVAEGEVYEMLVDVPVEAVQRAYDVTNDFAVVARTAREERIAGLDELDIELFRPIKVMLAQKAEGMEEAFDDLADEEGVVAAEVKYDGMRTQIHKQGDDIRVFTRRLEEVTTQFPEIVAYVEEQVDAEECIIEGEVVAYDPETGGDVPFQTLSKRIKRKYEIEQMVEEIPVVVHLFDVTYLDGVSLIQEPLRERWSVLQEILTEEEKRMDLAAHRETDSIEEADAFYQKALSGDHEGVMLKNLDAVYKPGSRVGYMVKLKPIMETLDLVIVEAEWSEGRKSDWLGRLFLACRDAEGNLQKVGRMSTGFTDEQLADITERLKPLIVEQDGRDVTLKPEVVVEVAYEEIQESPKYSSGYALRFPRFIGLREDKGVEDADTLERLEDLYDSQ